MTAFLYLTVSIILILTMYLLQGRSMKKAENPENQWPVLLGSACLTVIVIIVTVWESVNYASTKRMSEAVLLLPGCLYLIEVLLSWTVSKGRNMFSTKESKERELPFMVVRHGNWKLKSGFETFRTVMQAITVGQLVLTLAVNLLSLVFIGGPDWFVFAIPVSMLWLFNNLSIYLSAPVETPQNSSQERNPKSSETQTSYEKAVSHLAKTFPDALLSCASTAQKIDYQDSEMILKNLEESSNLNLIAAASYFRHTPDAKSLNPDYVSVTADLLDKKHVFIRDPFYQDLGVYLALPLEESLIRNSKVLILCQGEHMGTRVYDWVSDFLNSDSQLQNKWRIRQLGNLIPDCQIGILSYSKLFDPEVFSKNGQFFEECEYVILLHPSQILTTMQISLSVLAQKLKKGSRHPVYCIIDKDQIGLKDTLSHVLKIPVQSDTAMSQTAENKTVMVWDAEADFHSIEYFSRDTRYFGGGVDLAAQAVSAQVPKVFWVSGNTFPVLDIMDSASRAYHSICRVMGIEVSQKALRERIVTYPSLWNLSRSRSAFLLVEDEFCNPFATAANFESRGLREAVIGILSEPFLLRDYICANYEVFQTNPNAVPSLAPAYVRSGRNVLLKLILRMLEGPLTEHEITQELELAGIEGSDPLVRITELLELYTFADPDLFVVSRKQSFYGYRVPEIVTYIGVDPARFEHYFSDTLKNVSYILEDEQEEAHILDTCLYSLIVQTILPGQIFTCEGRRYIVKRISPSTGVVLQRASDRDQERKVYRQIRRYRFAPIEQGISVSERAIDGFVFRRLETEFSVDTLGYLEQQDRGDLQSARFVDFRSDTTVSAFSRHYVNKNVLFIRIPDTNQDILFFLAVMMQELMFTVIPDSCSYISVTAARPDSVDKRLNGIVNLTDYLPDGMIAVVEDSDMDLGLLDIVEEEFFELLMVIQDYLRWDQELIPSKGAYSVPDMSKWTPDLDGEGLTVSKAETVAADSPVLEEEKQEQMIDTPAGDDDESEQKQD